MKRGRGASTASPPGQPGKRRSTRGAALLAAAAGGGASSSSAAAVQTGSRSSKRAPVAKGGGRVAGEADAAQQEGTRSTRTSQVRSNGTAAVALRSSPRRAKKSSDACTGWLKPAGAAAAVSSTAVSRGTTKGRCKGEEATASSGTATVSATASTNPCPSPLSAGAAIASPKKGRTGGGRGKKVASEADTNGGNDHAGTDSDAAMKMLATLLSPVASTREDTRPRVQQQDQVRCAGVFFRVRQSGPCAG